jgi:cell division protein FtsX
MLTAAIIALILAMFSYNKASKSAELSSLEENEQHYVGPVVFGIAALILGVIGVVFLTIHFFF